MPHPQVLIRWERDGPFIYTANHCRWWKDYLNDVFTEQELNRLRLIRWLVNEGRIHEGAATVGRIGDLRTAADRLRGGRFAGRIGQRQ